jgi:hypothetical protein
MLTTRARETLEVGDRLAREQGVLALPRPEMRGQRLYE